MIYSDIETLLEQTCKEDLIQERDIIYVRNQVMHLLKITTYPAHKILTSSDSIPDLVDRIIEYAVKEDIIDNILDEKEMLAASLMNCFMPRPSTVQTLFDRYYKKSPDQATNYFYNLSKNSNYIQMNRIKKNISYKTQTEYGEMDITINLSKPEKDPEQIKRERMTKQDNSYPLCVLCRENEGYGGRIGYPARSNHRVIELSLGEEKWFFQYSPYVYYDEHSIVLSDEHRDMKINADTFRRLVEFVEKFPHYFIGSNADLPIVGGSILSHDHYQAGRYTFAMTNAEERYTFPIHAHPDVSAAVLKWPLTVIRLKANDQEKLVKAAESILAFWRDYDDEDASILSYSDDTPHNTITPIARMRDELYEMDLVLRNNRTTATHPLGIFHPHADVHHIKKENIGLIEVMGLAVLPPRLKTELETIYKFLTGKADVVDPPHEEWAQELREKHGFLHNEQYAKEVVQKELGKKFVRVLEDAGVFKDDTTFQRFISKLNQKVVSS
ncbi:UDP-glucose--hexose-1-phosphate uridylyltransferase [Terribacillus saccharophilus]|uniref:UDP-glucose--hexose-1-phosphate uridylyltransferase n=1 Tax=Terribacillus saccharophilus TaxID=361277 RepID=UPI000BA572B6|nr:UDP-glucose--hexose-1-phosphate uridylyltransferase [Terribacillus saccharophilus]PAF19035.1 UDP-glucose--hexose-1-phosphate uridylyltransferase [Terribacillus saccharophilus]PAF23200.1 UDP-glucose--hexose-1-phosphate uridylyltransferase [Terribacillus saccharophilus]PAF36883.1 UDP-glucose--hexose-1-phosphate uridylyltransferase [Terribacillus saccharophilus]